MTDTTLAAWEALIPQLGDATAWIAPDGRFRACNARFADMLGAPPQALCGRHYREAFHIEHLGQTVANEDLMGRILAGSDAGASPVGAMLKPVDAGPRLVDCTFSRVDTAAGPAGYVLIVRALSDFQQVALTAVRKSEGMWLALIENSHAAIYLKEAGGAFRYANKAFCDWVDVPPDRVVGKMEHEILPPQFAETIRARERDVFENDRPRTVEEVALLPAGGKILVSTRFSVPDNVSNRALVCCISTDVTKAKEMEQALREHERELAHVARFSMAGEMASGLAHELKQPLNVAMNLVETAGNMIDDPDVGTATVHEILGDACNAIVLASDIINRLRHFVNKKRVAEQDVDLGSVVLRAVRFMQHEFRHASVVVEHEFAVTSPIVMADAVQLEQVVINLLRNALDAIMAFPGAERLVRITIEADKTRHFSVTVLDGGPGLPKDVGERLFEPFYTTRANGMGLGLKISKSIIESFGGRIFARNRDRQGAAIGFTIPSSAA